MSGTVDPEVLAFFEEFERAGNTDDVESTRRQFADVFLNADPHGTNAIPRTLLVDSLPQRRQLFASIGLRNTRLSGISQTTLDDHYLLATTQWLAELVDGDELELSSTFLLHRTEGSLRIVLYLNHLDIIATIRARSGAAPN